MTSADFGNTVASQAFVLPIIKTGQRRRLSSDSSEEIWSDLTHSAFMEALVVYPPMGKCRLKNHQASPGIVSPNPGTLNSRPPKAFGRHQLIQSFIYRKTGKVRTTQQISSHIQRLKTRHRHNPALMALLVSSPFPGTTAGLNRVDFPSTPSTSRDVFPHDLTLENTGGVLSLHSPQHFFFPDFAGPLRLPEQATQNNRCHEVTGPALQEDSIGTFESRFFDFEAQHFLQPTQISMTSLPDSSTSTISQERLGFDMASFECQTQSFPVAFLGELSPFKDQDSHILPSNYCAPVMPAHTPVCPPEKLLQERRLYPGSAITSVASITTLSLSQMHYL